MSKKGEGITMNYNDEKQDTSITFADLEVSYKNFCVAAKDPVFRAEVFRGWGKPGNAPFTQEGRQEFEGV